MMNRWLSQNARSRRWTRPPPTRPRRRPRVDAGHGDAGAARGSCRTRKGADFDTLFLQLMIAHHEGALTMANEIRSRAWHDTGCRRSPTTSSSSRPTRSGACERWLSGCRRNPQTNPQLRETTVQDCGNPQATARGGSIASEASRIDPSTRPGVAVSQPRPPAAEPTPRVVVPAGTTAGAAVREAGLPGKGPDAVVVVRDVDGRLRDLSWTPDADAQVEPVAADTDDGRAVIRHSAAHVLAQAVQQQFPEAKLGIGPPVRDGFYYDFDVEKPFTPEDLQALEKRMKQIIKASQRFSRRVVESVDAAKEELAKRAVQARAGRPQVRRRHRRGHGGRRRRADHLRQPRPAQRRAGLGRPVPRPARADHQAHPGVQADPRGRRVLAGRREEPAAAAHLRHRVGVARRRRTPTWSGWPRPSGATTASWAPSWTCSPSRRRSAPGCRCSTPRAASSAARWRTTRGRRHEESGYEFVNTPHITKERAVPHLGAPAVLRGHHVPAAEVGGRGELLPQGHELPDAPPDLRRRAGGPTGSCRCGCSSSARCTGTRSPAWCTASPGCAG